MHTPANSTNCQRTAARPGAIHGATRLSAAEATALRVLSEQVAMPLDQLRLFLECSTARAIEVLQGLESAGYVCRRRFLVRDTAWFWLNSRGARLAGTGFVAAAPNVAMLAHRRAVNEVRLHLAERAPEGVWICERAVFRQRDPGEHVPDGVFEIAAERHAIEAELSLKGNEEIRRIVAEHSGRYDAVLYFCAPRPYRLLASVQAEGRWPKLVVRRLPGEK